MTTAQKYEVLARKYRPQAFDQVLGQDAVVSTLLNAIRMERTAHAYLFSGSRGTGKTTLARLYAKALNCLDPKENGEPCNQCSPCREITNGSSLDVIEIDGASNRGIDDIRQINETVGYAATGGKYKIYIIDEVHMLTKEAFNALLKTLEEPPKNVKFFFATTEPHKVLPTILSRCQHFQLRRISPELIIQKLRFEAKDMGIEVNEDALRLIAKAADGGMRDAESLFDQILAFTGNDLQVDSVAEILGLMPTERYFRIDEAAQNQDFSKAFAIADEVFTQGKDVSHFVEGLIEHYRNLLLVILGGKEHPSLLVSNDDKDRYEAVAKCYNREQCLDIIDSLLEAQQQLRFAPSKQIALEAILLRLVRSQRRVPVDVLVRRLMELENRLKDGAPQATPAPKAPEPTPPPAPPVAQPTPPQPQAVTQPLPIPTKAETAEPQEKPTPPVFKEETKPPVPPPPAPVAEPMSSLEQSRYDTLVQFAAVELNGAVEKNPKKRS